MQDEERGQSEIDRIVEAIVYFYTESRRVTKERARQHGLTGPQVTALKILEQVGELSLSELSAQMSAKNSTITGLVDRMERDGLVRRERSETDRRIVRLRATDKGKRIAAAVPVTAIEIFEGALGWLSSTDRKELTRILLSLAERVRERARESADDLASSNELSEERWRSKTK
ncbi:MAG: MarR family transcriptional regulator [Sandaracinaceae bacterium]|nr:MarR family transcriptional regulator [Sandaracinaceae bacterium]